MSLTSTQVSYLGRLEPLIGATRLGPYMAAEGGDLSRALARYYWNIDLCRAAYPALQVLEIDLRNRIDTVLTPIFPVSESPEAWRGIRSWLTRIYHPDIRPSGEVVVHPGGRETVTRALDKVLSKDPTQNARRTHDDLVAATSFGLWVGMLETAYDEPGTQGVYLWPTQKAKVFPGAKEEEMMTTIRTTLNGLRQFRNRVFHHEPIWAKSEKSPTPSARYADILQTLRWLSSEHVRLVTRLYEPVSKLDSTGGLEEARRRLLDGVDQVLEAAAKKKAEKEAVRAARKAAKNKES